MTQPLHQRALARTLAKFGGISGDEFVEELVRSVEAIKRTDATEAQFNQQYPNLAKETQVKALATEIFEFLEFLQGQGVYLARYGENGADLVHATHPSNRDTGYIDDYLELDRKATERERADLLRSVQAQGGVRPVVVSAPA